MKILDYAGGGGGSSPATPGQSSDSNADISSPYFAPNLFYINDAESTVKIRVRTKSPLGRTFVDGKEVPTKPGRTFIDGVEVDPTYSYSLEAFDDPKASIEMGKIAQSFSEADPSQITQYQQQLLAGHFYDSSYYGNSPPPIAFGQADDGTRKAFANALREAASSNGKASVDDVIFNHVKALAKISSELKPPKLTNPEDIKANAQTIAPNLTGRRLDDATLNQLTGRAEGLAQAQYTASNGQSAYYNSSPSQAWLEEQIRQLKPADTQAFQTAGNTGELLKLLDSNGLFSAYHA